MASHLILIKPNILTMSYKVLRKLIPSNPVYSYILAISVFSEQARNTVVSSPLLLLFSLP